MQLPRDHAQFIDDFAAHWERVGGNVTQGRVLALLFVSSNGEATATDIAETLGISRGAISQVTRQLIQMRLVQRVSRPGDRRDWFQITANPFAESARSRRAEVQTFIELFQRAHGLHQREDSRPNRALTNSIAFFQDYDDTLNGFFASWSPPEEGETS